MISDKEIKSFEEKIIDGLDKNLFIFYYQGSFLSKPSINILDLIENNIDTVLSRKMSKRAFFFGIELMQNIEKYSANIPSIIDSIAVIKTQNGVQLIAENAIQNDRIDRLKNHIDKVNNSSKEELRGLYHERLTNSIDEGAISPGLGIIEMNRKGAGNISYEFKEVDSEYSSYTITVAVSEEPDILFDSMYHTLLKTNFKDSDSAIFYTGRFDNDLLMPLVKMIENLELVNDKTIVSKYQHSLVEMIQNAHEHSNKISSINGFFSLKQSLESIKVSCCNIVDSSDDIEAYIKVLNSKSLDELKEMYRAALLDFNNDGGLGFVQIAQYSRPSPLISKSYFNKNSEKFFYLESNFGING